MVRRCLILAVFVTVALVDVQTASASQPSVKRTKQIICKVFYDARQSMRDCTDALRVAHCETGGTYSIWAQNGQYLGLFQMGSWARSFAGHGWNVWAQARAARRLWRAAGWSQWECSPYGAFRDG